MSTRSRHPHYCLNFCSTDFWIQLPFIYTEAERYCRNLSTSLNESFHSVLNVYLPKRVYLSERLYKMGSHLGILHLNELNELKKDLKFDGFRSSHVSTYIPLHPPKEYRHFRRDRNSHDMNFYITLWGSLLKILK